MVAFAGKLDFHTCVRDIESNGERNRVLLANMLAHTDRRARFVCALVAVRSADDPEPLIAFGRWDGELLEAPRGSAVAFDQQPIVHPARVVRTGQGRLVAGAIRIDARAHQRLEARAGHHSTTK